MWNLLLPVIVSLELGCSLLKLLKMLEGISGRSVVKHPPASAGGTRLIPGKISGAAEQLGQCAITSELVF